MSKPISKPTARLNQISYKELQSALALSLGRNIRTADYLEVTDFGDCYRNDFWWDDGACFSMIHDTKEESDSQIKSAGFK